MNSRIVTAAIVIVFIQQLAAGPPDRLWGRVEYQYDRQDKLSFGFPATDDANQDQQHQFMVYGNADLSSGKFFNIHNRLYSCWQPQDKPFKFMVLETYWDYAPGEQFLLRIGKQRVAWGTGYAWNPTDMLEPAKNPFRPQQEKEGILACKSDLLLGNFSLTVLSLYNDFFKRIELGAKLGLILASYEFSLSVHQVPFRSPSFGFDFVGFISRLELHGELALLRDRNYSFWLPLPYSLSRNSYTFKALLGSMYTLTPQVMLVVEYYHNESGSVYKEYTSFNPLFQNPYLMDLWKDTLFLMMLKREFLNIIDLQGVVFCDLNSQHFILAPRITIVPLAAVSVEVMYYGLARFNGPLSQITGWSNKTLQLKVYYYF
jgi:hypothetical protein